METLVMPPLPFIVDNIDSIPEPARPFYEQHDGKHRLSLTLPDNHTIEDVSGLKTSLSSARRERDEAKARAKKYEDALGDRPLEEVIEQANRMAELGDDADINARVEAGIKSREEKLTRKFNEEKESIENQRKRAMGQLEKMLVRDAIQRAVTDAKGNTNLLSPILESRVRMKVNDDGNFMVEVLDADGNPAVGDSQGNPQTIPGLVNELKSQKEYAAAFEGTGATGTGAKGGGGGGTPSNTPAGGGATVSRSDARAMSANLEKIASGEVTVVD